MKKITKFIMEAAVLRRARERVTRDISEEGIIFTGNRFGNVRILAELIDLPAAFRSPVEFTCDRKAYANTLIDLYEAGRGFNATGHSHPGVIPESTHWSRKDWDYFTAIQKAGSDAIGLIFNRGGYVRFFSPIVPFTLMIQGNGIRKVGDNVYLLEKI